MLHPAIVRDDAVQPRAKFGFAVELMQFAVHIDECILPRLFRFFLIAADFEGETVHKLFVLLHKFCERAFVSRLRLLNEGVVIEFGNMERVNWQKVTLYYNFMFYFISSIFFTCVILPTLSL
jgi:hypothetical protein